MSSTTFDTERINNISPSDLESHGLLTKSAHGSRKENHGYCCVYCNSGAGHNQTGALNFDYRDGRWSHYCHSCGNGGDNIKLFRQIWSTDFRGACQQASETFAIPAVEGADNYSTPRKHGAPPSDNNNAPQTRRVNLPEKTPREQVPFIKADIADAQEHLQQLPEDQRRGLLIETLQHFNCGFAPCWAHPKCRLEGTETSSSPRIIIPTPDGEHYLALALDRDRKRDPKNSFHKPHAGAKTTLFNADDLKKFDTILVVEGEINAMSIWQAVMRATHPNALFDERNKSFGIVATLSAGGWKNLIIPQIDAGLIKWHKFVIMFDRDSNGAGQNQAAEFQAALKARNFPVSVKFLDDFLPDELKPVNGKIDANDLLKAGKSYDLRTAVLHIIAAAEDEFGDIANQIPLMDAPPPIDHNAISGAMTVSKKTQAPPPFTGKFAEWEMLNGALSDDMKKSAADAHIFLAGLNADNLTPDLILSSNLKHALAQCSFCDIFAADVTNFYALFESVTQAAKDRVLTSKQLGTARDDNDLAWLNLSAAPLKQAVADICKQLKRDHKKFLRAETKRRAEEDAHAAVLARSAQKGNLLAQLDMLREQNPSATAYPAMIELIRDACDWKLTPHGDRVEVKSTLANANLIFTYDPHLDGLFAYDLFLETIIMRREPPWAVKGVPRVDTEWSDDDDDQLQFYLRDTYTEFNSEKLVDIAVTEYARRRAYNEVHEFIHNLPEWDGVPRAATLFIDFLGAADTVFHRAATCLFLLGYMSRIFHPGCDFQYCIVLNGGQHIGKSKLAKMLAGGEGVNPNGKSWHVALHEKLDDPHAIDAIMRGTIIELEEYSGAKKTDVAAIKSFISTPADTRRLAYKERAATIRRHCVFIITINDTAFLRDPTGSTRFNVIECTRETWKQVNGLTPEYIRQVLAETYRWYKVYFEDGFDESKLHLPYELRIESEQRNEKFLIDDGMQSQFTAWLERPILPQFIWQLLTLEERSNFCRDGKWGGAEVVEDLLARRRQQLAPKTLKQDLAAIREYCRPYDDADETGNPFVRMATVVSRYGNSTDMLTLYGSERRQHVCVAEIYKECFPGSDKRKTLTRINELFNALEGHGWHKGKRLRSDKCYGDQKNVLYRDEVTNATPDHPDDNSSPNNVPVGDSTLADDDTSKIVPEGDTSRVNFACSLRMSNNQTKSQTSVELSDNCKVELDGDEIDASDLPF